MITGFEGNLKRTVAAAMLGLILVSVGSFLLSVAVGLGITSAEMAVGPASQDHIDRLRRASYVAFALSFAAALSVSLLALKSRVPLLPGLHWSVRFLCLFVVAVLCFCAGAVLLVAYGGSSEAVWHLDHSVSDFIVRITP